LKAIIGGSHPYEFQPPDLPDGSDPALFLRHVYRLYGIDFDQLPAEMQKKFLTADCRAWAATAQPRASQEHLLASITAPCLIYAGEQDDAVFEKAKQAVTRIADCRFVAVPGLHAPAFQNSAAILPQALAFLAKPH
jgi:pimeloyl-ACP methyl ester carboxylesterase